jgi:hypothetical protein
MGDDFYRVRTFSPLPSSKASTQAWGEPAATAALSAARPAARHSVCTTTLSHAQIRACDDACADCRSGMGTGVLKAPLQAALPGVGGLGAAGGASTPTEARQGTCLLLTGHTGVPSLAGAQEAGGSQVSHLSAGLQEQGRLMCISLLHARAHASTAITRAQHSSITLALYQHLATAADTSLCVLQD